MGPASRRISNATQHWRWRKGQWRGGDATETPRGCHGDAMETPCRCHVDAMQMSWRCHVDAMDMSWRCHGDVMEMPWRCHGDVMDMPWRCSGDAVEMPRKCHGDAITGKALRPQVVSARDFACTLGSDCSHPPSKPVRGLSGRLLVWSSALRGEAVRRRLSHGGCGPRMGSVETGCELNARDPRGYDCPLWGTDD